MQTINDFFGLARLIPHGYCLLWNPVLLWLHVISDAIIALAYFSIPLSMFWFLRQSKKAPYPWLIRLFGLFILACGTSHLLSVFTIWLPLYWLDGFIKLFTAAVSISAAVAMLWIIPKALQLPSPAQLQLEIDEHKKADFAHREALGRLQKIASQIPGVVYQLRMRPDGSFCFPYASDALFDISHLHPEDVMDDGTKIFELTHSDDKEKLLTSMCRSAHELSLWRKEFRIILDDGTVSWLLGKAVPQREADGSTLWHGFVTDITEQKNIEEELNKRRDELTHYFEQPLIGMLTANHKKNTIHANQRYCDIVGYSKKEMKTLDWGKITHPDDMTANQLLLDQAIRGEIDCYQMEKRYIHKDGHIVYAHLAVDCIRDANGVLDYTIGMILDISESKLTEIALKFYSDKLNRRVKELDCLSAISELARNIDLSHAEVLQKTLALLVNANPCQAQTGVRILWNYEQYCTENFKKTRWLQESPIWVYGEQIGSIQQCYFENCAQEDETLSHQESKLLYAVANILGKSYEHRLSDESLKQSEKRFRNIFDHSPIGVINLSHEGQFLAVNQTCCDILGYSQNELLYMTFMEVIQPEDLNMFSRYMYQMLTGGIIKFSFEIQFVRKDQSRVWGNLSMKMIFSGDGQSDYIVAILEDISQRRKAEDEILATHKQLQATINAIPDILLEMGLDGRYYQVQSPHTSILSTSSEQLIGKKVSDIYPPDVSEVIMSALREAHENKWSTGKQVKISQANKNIWFEFSVAHKDNDTDQPHFIVLVRNITERKDLEQALLTSKRYYEALVSVSPVGVFQTDIQGNCNFVNPTWSKITGLSLDDSLAQGWTSTIYPDDLDTVLTKWRDAITMEKTFYLEFRYLQADGTVKWVLAQSAPLIEHFIGIVGYIGTITDITDRKNAEIKLIQSEHKFRHLLQLIPLPVYIVDVLSDITFINNRFVQLFGFNLNDIPTLNDWWLKAYPDETYRNQVTIKAKTAIDKAISEGIDIEPDEFNVTSMNGIVRNILFSGIVFDDSVISVGVDITERKLMEAELKRSNTELEQFAYAISHDMRQPLRMISSFLVLIENALTGQLNEETQQYINFAVEGAKRMDAMIISLLDYSRVGRKIAAQKLISSRAALNEALVFLEPDIVDSDGTIEVSGAWPDLIANSDELTRLLQNLIGNALKYHEENEPPRVEVCANIQGKMFRVAVRDSGIGISPEQTQRLFKVFSRLQARSRFEGTGVGLALCRKIVENHGGKIGVESEGEGHGSVFWFELPMIAHDIK